jgi:hypothetical protein
MTRSFTLRVPTDAHYRALARDVASRYVELVGGTGADAQALGRALGDALEQLAAGAPADASVDLAFDAGGRGIEVILRCADRSVVVTRPLAARR